MSLVWRYRALIDSSPATRSVNQGATPHYRVLAVRWGFLRSGCRAADLAAGFDAVFAERTFAAADVLAVFDEAAVLAVFTCFTAVVAAEGHLALSPLRGLHATGAGGAADTAGAACVPASSISALSGGVTGATRRTGGTMAPIVLDRGAELGSAGKPGLVSAAVVAAAPPASWAERAGPAASAKAATASSWGNE